MHFTEWTENQRRICMIPAEVLERSEKWISGGDLPPGFDW